MEETTLFLMCLVEAGVLDLQLFESLNNFPDIRLAAMTKFILDSGELSSLVNSMKALYKSSSDEDFQLLTLEQCLTLV